MGLFYFSDIPQFYLRHIQSPDAFVPIAFESKDIIN